MFGGLFTLLLIAALFYFVFRYSGGVRLVHERQAIHPGGNGVSVVPGEFGKDPVCGMAVGPGEGYSEVRGGRTYHFCSRSCLDKFDAEPRSYVS